MFRGKKKKMQGTLTLAKRAATKGARSKAKKFQKGAVLIQHNSIINRTSGSDITLPHLRESCLQITSASVQD